MKKKVSVLNKVHISKEKILFNYNYLKNISFGKNIFPVVKANAYGHGINEVVSILDSNINVPKYYLVDSYYEALKIKNISKTKILIMAPSSVNNIKHIQEKEITLTVTNFDILKETVSLKKPIKIHLFFNTGMNREGFIRSDIDKILKNIKDNKKILVEGIFSHFATADDVNEDYLKIQESEFSEILDIFEKEKLFFKYIHLGNSAGFLKTRDKRINSFRSGLALYGINPLAKKDIFYNKLEKLKPVMKLLSTVTDIQKIKKGQVVGYNRAFKAKNDMVIGVFPIGYYEFYFRQYGEKGFVKINDRFCEILGKINMNMTSINITDLSFSKSGCREIVVLSDIVEDKNSASSIAKEIHTIPYEILVNVLKTTRRIIV